jgi:hypothetical protein
MSHFVLMRGPVEEQTWEGTHAGCLPPAPEGAVWVGVPSEQYTVEERDGAYVPVIRSVPLADAQIARWAAAKIYRDARMNATCATPLGRVERRGEPAGNHVEGLRRSPRDSGRRYLWPDQLDDGG